MCQLRRQRQNCDALEGLASTERPVLDVDDAAQLQELGISKSDIEQAVAKLSFEEKNPIASLESPEAYNLYLRLADEARAAITKYREEAMALEDEHERVRGRKKDFTPALHCWVKKLAERGILDDVIKACTGDS